MGLDVDDWAREARSLAQRLRPDELISRLPRHLQRALPPTSPLFHYPHPWMRSKADGFSAVQDMSPRDASRVAPVYANGHGVPACGAHRSWRSLATPWALMSSGVAW